MPVASGTSRIVNSSHFDTLYPQVQSWQLHPLPCETNASLIGALFRKRPKGGYPISATATPTQLGFSGMTSAPASISLQSLSPKVTPSLYSNSLLNATAPALSRPAATLSDLEQWRMPYERWVNRRTPRRWAPDDPRLNAHGEVDMWVTSLYRTWTRIDEPPRRVKPLPLRLGPQRRHRCG